jgi:FAD:protein FMN transferase
MNTRFELVLWGKDETYLTAAGEEALREIAALDQQLSFYRDDSDVRELNALAAHRAVTVEPRLFRLLERARELSRATEGAFDITIGPLLRAWGLTGEGGRVPAPEEVEAARAITGMELVELDSDARTVRFLREGVMIDLGAIGKGYGIERAMELLAEHELSGVLLHGGTSTVAATGTQPDGSPWTIAIRDPRDPDAVIAQAGLGDAALSVSAPHGRAFIVEGREIGHVLDPRTGAPAEGALLAAVRCPSPTDSDALSTGLLVAGEALFPALKAWGPGCAALVLRRDGTRADMTSGAGATETAFVL